MVIEKFTRKPLPSENVALIRAHPLVRGMEACLLLNDVAGGFAVDLVRHSKSPIVGCVRAVRLDAVCLDTAAAGDKIQTERSFSLGNTWSIRIVCYRLSSGIGTAFGRYFGTAINLTELLNAGDNVDFSINGTAVYTGAAGVFSVDPGVRNDVVITSDGANVRTYSKGSLVRTDAFTGSMDSGAIVFGNILDGSRTGDVIIEQGQVWSRPLSGAEVHRLYFDPWGYLRPVIRRTYFVAAAAEADELLLSRRLIGVP